MEKYEFVKHLHGEIYNYAVELQRKARDTETTNRLHQLIDAARNIMYAAKNVKDAGQDIDQLKKSSKDQKYDYYLATRERVSDFFKKILELVEPGKSQVSLKEVTDVYQSIQESYKVMLSELRGDGLREHLTEVEFSTVVNFNREIYTLEKSIAFAVKSIVLNEADAGKFDELPGFIR